MATEDQPVVNMFKVGDYQFSVSTAALQNIKRSSAWRWQSQERLGVRPAQQYLGPGAESLSLSGVIYPHYKGGVGQLDRMRAEAGQGKPLILVNGLGEIQGQWVITQVEETQTVFTAGGIPRKVEFSMQLSRYGEDK